MEQEVKEQKTTQGRSWKNQVIAVILVNTISFTQGNIAGWLSPALLFLCSESTHIESGPLHTYQVSWLAASLYLGATVGVIVSQYITAKFGCRLTLMSLGVPQLIWWGFIAGSTEYWHLVAARAIVGYTQGNYTKVISYYVAEISEPNIRGKLGSMMLVIANLGVLFAFNVGHYIEQVHIPWSFIFSAVYIALIYFFIPETPPFLLKKGKIDEARKSFYHYRSVGSDDKVSEEIQMEFNDMVAFQSTIKGKSTYSWQLLKRKDVRFGIWMSTFLSLTIHFAGGFVLTQFTATIFQQSGSSLEPGEAAIIVETLQILGNICSIFLVDRIGRKPLYCFSSMSAALFLSALGLYSYFDRATTIDVTVFSWIPIVSFSLAIFVLSIGTLTITYTIITEILPAEIKGDGLTISTAFSMFIGAFVIQGFPILVDEIQIYGTMWLHAGCCVLAVLVTAIFLPETRGKKLN